MKALFFAILRASLVIAIGMIFSAVVAFWMFSGNAPTSVKELKQAAKDLASFHEIKKQLVAKSYTVSETVKDDFDQPAGVNSDTIAQAAEEDARLAKINDEIAQVHKNSAKQRDIQNEKDITMMKNKLASLQAQLDRIENQNRILTLQISGLVKNGKVQNQESK